MVVKKTFFKKNKKGQTRLYAKAKRKTGQFVTKRYLTAGGMNRLTSDVNLLKKIVNAEKKAISTNIAGQALGQVVGNLAGYYAIDFTPSPAQGVAGNQRIGDSIKIVSYHYQMQFIGQANAVSAQRYKMYIIQWLGNPITSGTCVPQIWNTNNFVGGGGQIIDMNSMNLISNYAKYKIVHYRSIYIAPDSISGQVGIKTLNGGGKFQHHIRFNGSTGSLENGQLWLVLLADNGNCSPTVTSTLSNIPNSNVNSGCTFSAHLRTYYVDN